MDDFKEIKKIVQKLEKTLDEAGMVGKARKKFMLGEEIITCPFCGTYNCYSGYYDEEDGWERFTCSKCGQFHIKIHGK